MITVWDDVLTDPVAYRKAALQLPFSDAETDRGVVFHRIAPAPNGQLSAWIRQQFPALHPGMTFLRQSPHGQREPNFIHTDSDMGEWTAILYLNPTPAEGDGTTFWMQKGTRDVVSTAQFFHEVAEEWARWLDREQWDPWMTVEAKFNRVVLFPARCFHSRAIEENYGQGDEARLIQVMFGTGALSSWQ